MPVVFLTASIEVINDVRDRSMVHDAALRHEDQVVEEMPNVGGRLVDRANLTEEQRRHGDTQTQLRLTGTRRSGESNASKKPGGSLQGKHH
jgi:hypothetical protein